MFQGRNALVGQESEPGKSETGTKGEVLPPSQVYRKISPKIGRPPVTDTA